MKVYVVVLEKYDNPSQLITAFTEESEAVKYRDQNNSMNTGPYEEFEYYPVELSAEAASLFFKME